MRKSKEKKTADQVAAQQEKSRRDAISEFNVTNMGKFWIDPDRVPTKEDTEGAKKEFEDFVKSLQEKKDYVIADKANALRVAKFMQQFIDKAPWTGMEFVGILQFHDYIQDFLDKWNEDDPKDLVFEYGAMEFAYLKFVGRGGIGIESAKVAKEENEEYVPICDKLYDLHNWYELQKKKAENLQTRWRMFEQGYYLYVLEGTDEEGTSEDQTGKSSEGPDTAAEPDDNTPDTAAEPDDTTAVKTEE